MASGWLLSEIERLSSRDMETLADILDRQNDAAKDAARRRR